MKNIISLTLVLLSISFIGTVIYSNDTPPPQVLENGSRLKWTPCWFKIPTLKTVSCAYFFPANGKPIKLRIPVVVVKNLGTFPLSTPVLYLAGGPGYPTGLTEEDMKEWWEWIDAQQWPGDLVLFDQRGTGLSRPTLTCPEITNKMRKVLSQPLSQEQLFNEIKPSLRRCYSRLRKQGIQFSWYTTSNNAHDARS